MPEPNSEQLTGVDPTEKLPFLKKSELSQSDLDIIRDSGLGLRMVSNDDEPTVGTNSGDMWGLYNHKNLAQLNEDQTAAFQFGLQKVARWLLSNRAPGIERFIGAGGEINTAEFQTFVNENIPIYITKAPVIFSSASGVDKFPPPYDGDKNHEAYYPFGKTGQVKMGPNDYVAQILVSPEDFPTTTNKISREYFEHTLANSISRSLRSFASGELINHDDTRPPANSEESRTFAEQSWELIHKRLESVEKDIIERLKVEQTNLREQLEAKPQDELLRKEFEQSRIRFETAEDLIFSILGNGIQEDVVNKRYTTTFVSREGATKDSLDMFLNIVRDLYPQIKFSTDGFNEIPITPDTDSVLDQLRKSQVLMVNSSHDLSFVLGLFVPEEDSLITGETLSIQVNLKEIIGRARIDLDVKNKISVRDNVPILTKLRQRHRRFLRERGIKRYESFNQQAGIKQPEFETIQTKQEKTIKHKKQQIRRPRPRLKA